MDTLENNWISLLPDPEEWPSALVKIVRHGEFILWRHNDQWVILLSTTEGDLISVQGNGVVQARLAVDRLSGEVVYPSPGVCITEWEAEVMGEEEVLRESRERLKNAPLRPEDWNRMEGRKGRSKEA